MNKIKTTLISARWFFVGIIYFLALMFISVKLGLTHTTPTENFYSIAWTYVAIAIGILSLTYPFFLSLRESLNKRLFMAYEKIKGTDNPKLKEDEINFIDYYYRPLQLFRQRLFDKLLPILATYSALSITRVLCCIINVGPFTNKQQIIEPQIYLLGYMFLIGWAVKDILVLKPFAVVEDIESKISGLPTFEISYKQDMLRKSKKHNESKEKALKKE